MFGRNKLKVNYTKLFIFQSMYVKHYCLKYVCDAFKSQLWTISADMCLCYDPMNLSETIENADPHQKYIR